MTVQITEEVARQLADSHLDGWRKHGRTDIVVDRIEEHSRAWIAYYATEQYRATRSFLHLLVGASPIVIDKATGEIHVYGSAPEEYAKFLAWCDKDQ